MHDTTRDGSPRLAYDLTFRSLFFPGRGYAFPCDASGRVDLDALAPRARDSFMHAQACVGRELASPAVVERLAEQGADVTCRSNGA